MGGVGQMRPDLIPNDYITSKRNYNYPGGMNGGPTINTMGLSPSTLGPLTAPAGLGNSPSPASAAAGRNVLQEKKLRSLQSQQQQILLQQQIILAREQILRQHQSHDYINGITGYGVHNGAGGRGRGMGHAELGPPAVPSDPAHGMRSALLEEFRNNKNKKYELRVCILFYFFPQDYGHAVKIIMSDTLANFFFFFFLLLILCNAIFIYLFFFLGWFPGYCR